MKTTRTQNLIAAALVGAVALTNAEAQTAPKMKMTTPIPPSITTPDSVETSLGTLKFFDGLPDKATVEKVYDNLDLSRGVQAFLTAIPGASMVSIRNAIRGFGPDNQTVVLFEDLMDSKSLFLTASTDSVYAWAWLNLKDGPTVLETPPNVLGVIDDFWFRYVMDFGNGGPDKGQGGKFLIVPPGYKGEIPAGYFVAHSPTFNNLFFWRGFTVKGDPKPAVTRMPAMAGYTKGVPMGGDLAAAPAGKAPTFLVAALKDPIGANLDRYQIIKGWLDAKGEVHEKIYDVAVSGGREIGADGRCKTPVGNTVDVENATWSNIIGAPELITVWKDPDFDPAQRAFYYGRVIEIPTPRWTAYDAKKFNVKMPKEVPMTTTERAYTSPIWYTPAK